MKINFTVELEKIGTSYLALITNPEYAGIVEQEDTIQEVLRELMTSFCIKLEYDGLVEINLGKV